MWRGNTEGMEKQQVSNKEQIYALPCGTTYSPELSKCSHLLLKSPPQGFCKSLAKASQRFSATASQDEEPRGACKYTKSYRRQVALLFLTLFNPDN